MPTFPRGPSGYADARVRPCVSLPLCLGFDLQPPGEDGGPCSVRAHPAGERGEVLKTSERISSKMTRSRALRATERGHSWGSVAAVQRPGALRMGETQSGSDYPTSLDVRGAGGACLTLESPEHSLGKQLA